LQDPTPVGSVRRVIAALSTGHKIGLGGSALIFIAFALFSAMLLPRRRPDFPARALPAFLIATAAMFIGMLAAVEIFGVEEEESKAEGKPPAAAPGGVPSSSEIASGKRLYASLGCSGCHTLTGAKGTGPSFKGVAGSKVALTDGSSVTADEAYLLESIQDPDKQIVAGFAKGVMSSAIKPGSVSDADAKALVAFIQSLK